MNGLPAPLLCSDWSAEASIYRLALFNKDLTKTRNKQNAHFPIERINQFHNIRKIASFDRGCRSNDNDDELTHAQMENKRK